MENTTMIFICGVAVVSVVVPLILIVLAEMYVDSNRGSFIDYQSDAYKLCADTAARLLSLQDRFHDIIYKYELNKTVACSSSVVARAENDNIKYILKYSNLKQDRKCASDLDFCNYYLEVMADFQVEFSQLLDYMKEQIPKIYLVFLSKRKLRYILTDCCGFDETVVDEIPPVFTFYYRSPQGRSGKICRIPLTGSFVLDLKSVIEENLDMKNYVRRQRSAMTKDLREYIKKRDNYTCRRCGNSIYREPNLLLEIDHIVPVSKGGKTEPSNLQTLCWKCNRSKSNS